MLNRHCFVLLEVNGKVAFDQPASGERFLLGPANYMGNGLTTMRDFHFRDLEMTLKGHPRSKVMSHDAL